MTVWEPLVPERPLRWGEMLVLTFRYIRRYPVATLGVGALLGTVTSVVNGVVIDGFLAGSGRLDAFQTVMQGETVTATQMQALGDAMVSAAPYLALATVTSLLVQLAAMGVMTLGMVRAMSGATVDPSTLWREVPWRRVITINVLVAVVLLVVVMVPAGIAFSAGSPAVAIAALAIASVLAFLVAVTSTLAVPVAIMEDLAARPALRRALEVMRGAVVRTSFLVFGSLVVWDGVGNFIGTPIGSLFGALLGGSASATGSALATLLTNIVHAAITLPTTSAMAVLITVDRIRRMGAGHLDQ